MTGMSSLAAARPQYDRVGFRRCSSVADAGRRRLAETRLEEREGPVLSGAAVQVPTSERPKLVEIIGEAPRGARTRAAYRLTPLDSGKSARLSN
jgi:hypothetical protein